MVQRTRRINGRTCVMYPGSKKMPTEQAAIEYAKNELKLDDFEVAQTGISTWRVYTSEEPKVEKKPRERKGKKSEIAELKEVVAELQEKVTDLEASASDVKQDDTEQKEQKEDVGSVESEATPLQAESHTVVDDLTEFGKSIIETLRNNLDPIDPDFSDVDAATLAQKLGKKINAVTGALTTLVSKNYVTTLQDEEEGKPVSIICLTQKGWNAAL